MQPIIARAKPSVLDAYIFAATTCLIMTIIYFPLMIIERKRIKQLYNSNPSFLLEKPLLLVGWKKYKLFLLYIGINFAIAQTLFFVAYENAGAINGSLAQQTEFIFALLFGYLIYHEKISKTQLLFSCILFIALIFTVTQGSFNLIEINIGVFVMCIVCALWLFAHTLSKPLLENGEISAVQLAFIRNLISGSILISTYFIFYPIKNIKLFLSPINMFFFIAMGVIYAIDLLFWYKSLSYIEVSKASVIVSPMPILTAVFAFFILGEIFTIFHLIGTIVIIISIMMIVKEKKRSQ
jgi:drug/metabolite transporter (DMT)-like permease